MAPRHRLHRFFQVCIDVRVIQNGFGMNTNVVVDDELQSCQANALVGQLRKVKCQLRIAHIHHDFGGNFGHGAPDHFGHFRFEQSIVNTARITFGTTHGHKRAIFQLRGGIATSHHGWNTQLSGNDGRMAGTPSPVGHDGAGALHDGLPIGICHVSHQHIASLHLVHLCNTVYQSNRARANFLANGTAFSQHRALAFEFVTKFGRAFRLALHGFRSSLQNINQAVGAIFAPFDVHRAAVMLFNHHGILRQLGDVCIGQGIAIAQLHGHIHRFHQLA